MILKYSSNYLIRHNFIHQNLTNSTLETKASARVELNQKTSDLPEKLQGRFKLTRSWDVKLTSPVNLVVQACWPAALTSPHNTYMTETGTVRDSRQVSTGSWILWYLIIGNIPVFVMINISFVNLYRIRED